ncbi:MAG: plasmid pRiA4b ORF-3 family protein [Caldilineaceae bacterium]
MSPQHDQFQLSSAQAEVLRNTLIDQQHPGSLLQDFAMLLTFIHENAPQLTGTLLLPLKVLEPLNARLAHPIQHGLRRPQQKSFPHLNGLFWLVRTSGLTRVDKTGKKPRLQLDEPTYHSWQALNPTEQYCTLLESWTLRAQSEIIGERDAFGFNRVVEMWDSLYHRVPAGGLSVAGNADLEQSLGHFPGYHNLALMALFGLVTVQSAPPLPGMGWRIAKIQRTLLGEALHVLVRRFIFGDPQQTRDGLWFRYSVSSEIPIGALQPVLQPYWPAWQNNLRISGTEFCGDLHIFKVALTKDIWRRIAIAGTDLLDELSDIILRAYGFDFDHLYRFTYMNRFGGESYANHPYLEEAPFTSEVRIGDLPLEVGSEMSYLYDFGDHWDFTVTLERIEPRQGTPQAQIIATQGDAPEQYYVWSDEEEEA